MNNLIIFFLRIYQKTLSPDHGLLRSRYPYGFCRMYPSCSEYSIQAFIKYNVLKALLLTIKRLIKCNPFTEPQINKL